MTFILRTFGHSIVLGRGASIDGYGGSLALAAALLVCMPAYVEANARGFSYILMDCVGWGKGMPASHHSLRRHVWYACQGSGGKRVVHSSFLLSPFHFQGLGEGGI